MGILSWIIFGLIAGILAKWIMPGPDPGGCIVTTLIGIAGAFVGKSFFTLYLRFADAALPARLGGCRAAQARRTKRNRKNVRSRRIP